MQKYPVGKRLYINIKIVKTFQHKPEQLINQAVNISKNKYISTGSPGPPVTSHLVKCNTHV